MSDKSGDKPSSEKTFSSETPSKISAPSIMSAPAEKKPFPMFLVLSVACAVSAALAIFFLVLLLSANAKISQFERDIEDYKSTVLNLKNQINELDK